MTLLPPGSRGEHMKTPGDPPPSQDASDRLRARLYWAAPAAVTVVASGWMLLDPELFAGTAVRVLALLLVVVATLWSAWNYVLRSPKKRSDK
jgi:hypothetical protein